MSNETLTAEELDLIRDFARYDGEDGRPQTNRIRDDLWGRPGIRRLLATLVAARQSTVDVEEHRRQSSEGTHLYDESCPLCQSTVDVEALALCDKHHETAEGVYGCILPMAHEAAGIRGHHWASARARASLAALAESQP